MIYYSSFATIAIDPPIPCADLTARAVADDRTPTPVSGDESSTVDLASTAEASTRLPADLPRYTQWGGEVGIGDLAFEVDPDHPDGPCAIAIISGSDGESGGGRDLYTALQRVITDFARADDGTIRTFTGYLEYEDGDYGSSTRVYVRDGTTATEEAELTWPGHPPGEPNGIPADPTAEAYLAQVPATEVDTTAAPPQAAAGRRWPRGRSRAMSTTTSTAGIAIDPPIPYTALAAKADADAAARARPAALRYRYLFDGIDIADLTLTIDRHHPDGPCVTAIHAAQTPPPDGFTRRSALARIIADFARTGDGSARTFTGHLACERGGDPSRLYIRDGEVVETAPDLIWHDPPGRPVGTPLDPAVLGERPMR